MGIYLLDIAYYPPRPLQAFGVFFSALPDQRLTPNLSPKLIIVI
jgi:hypothetical protein